MIESGPKIEERRVIKKELRSMLRLVHSCPLQDSGDLATDFSVAKSKKSVSKSFSDGFATEKNSVGKTLLAKLSDGNLQSVAKFSEGL